MEPGAAQQCQGPPSNARGCPATPGAAQQRQGPPSNARGRPATTRGRPATTRGRPATTRVCPAMPRATRPPSNNQGLPSNATGHSTVTGPIQQHESGQERPLDHIGHRWATSINCGPSVSMWGCPSQHIVVKDCHYICLLQGG